MSGLVITPSLNASFKEAGNDWDAIEQWLSILTDSRSPNTVTTYRFHLAKLRWYCEHRCAVPLRMWNRFDFQGFKDFLHSSPFDSICPKGARQGDANYTPFRIAPARGSAADIIRFVHALFGVWHAHGYVALNPAIDHQTPCKITTRSAHSDCDFLDRVLNHIKSQLSDDPRIVRDLFVIMILRELGLFASELVEARMRDVAPHPRPSFERAAIFRAPHNRILPMSSELLSVFHLYRRAFGLSATVRPDEELPLVLSIRKTSKGFQNDPQSTNQRGSLRGIRSRYSIFLIVKSRICAVADELEHAGNMSSMTVRKFANTRWIRHVFERDTMTADGNLLDTAHKMGWEQPSVRLKRYLSTPTSSDAGDG